MKEPEAGSILAASKRPCQLHPNNPTVEDYLPPTKHVSWEWRKTKCYAIGVEKPAFRFREIPEIAAKWEISSLSTRNRERRMQEIEDAKRAADWGRHAEVLLEKERQHATQEVERRREEVEQLQKYVEKHEKYKQESSRV